MKQNNLAQFYKNIQFSLLAERTTIQKSSRNKKIIGKINIKEAIYIMAALATIIGLFLLFIQSVLVVKQLEKLTAEAKIDISFHLTTPTIFLGPTVSEPIDFYVIPRNNGNGSTSYWKAMIFFCDGVVVEDYDSNWKKTYEELSRTYLFESRELLPSGLKSFSDVIDEIGFFSIRVPTDGGKNLQEPIPIATVHAYGKKSVDASLRLISLSPYDMKFIYDKVIIGQDKIISDFRECANVRFTES